MLHFPIICRSCMTIFACCQTISRVRKRLCMCDLEGKTNFISIDKESVCFLQLSQDRGGLPLTGLVTVPEDLTQCSQFSCAFVGSFPQISWPSYMASFFLLPPHHPRFYISLIPAWRTWLPLEVLPRKHPHFFRVANIRAGKCMKW